MHEHSASNSQVDIQTVTDVATGNGTICALLRRRDRPDYVAAIKLKPGDDGSCMWMLRSQDAETRVAIKEALD